MKDSPVNRIEMLNLRMEEKFKNQLDNTKHELERQETNSPITQEEKEARIKSHMPFFIPKPVTILNYTSLTSYPTRPDINAKGKHSVKTDVNSITLTSSN